MSIVERVFRPEIYAVRGESANVIARTPLKLDHNYSVIILEGMSELTFEWDTAKATSNLQKHGVSFEEAKTVFTDQFARMIADPDHSADEDRFILLGTSIRSNLLVVCHCIRHEDTIRIISARKADKQERKIYEVHSHA